jgi:hypothetical protein
VEGVAGRLSAKCSLLSSWPPKPVVLEFLLLGNIEAMRFLGSATSARLLNVLPPPILLRTGFFYATGLFKPLTGGSGLLSGITVYHSKPLEFKFQIKMAYTNGLQRLTAV